MVPALMRRAYIGSAGPDYREAAESPDVRIHDLRDTYASFGVKGGQSLFVVGQLLGHSRITTTQRYAYLAGGPIRRASDAIGEELAGR